MSLPHLSVRPCRRLVTCASAFFILAGCASERGAREDRRDAAAAAPAAPMPEMEAKAVFFAGQLETEVLLGSGGFAPRAAKDAAGSTPREERSPGSFSGGAAGGGGGRRGGKGGASRGGEGAESRASGRGEPAPRIRASNAPPVQFHLRLTNHGGEPIAVEVTDFNSDLGNFVVQPRLITVPPGGWIEADPMTSRLGLSADEIPVTITLRAGGRTEKQVVILRPKAGDPLPSPAPAAARSP